MNKNINANNKVNNEATFIEWMTNTIGLHGKQYEKNTIDNYTSTLRTSLPDMLLELLRPYSSIFEISDVEHLDEIYAKIKRDAAYDEFNLSRNQAPKYSLECYRRFLSRVSLTSMNVNDNCNVNNEVAFIEWMRNTPKNNRGELYSENTIKSYVSSLTCIADEFNDILFPIVSVFVISDVREFDKIYTAIKTKNYFESFNDSRHGAPKASMERYRKFLVKSEGDVNDMKVSKIVQEKLIPIMRNIKSQELVDNLCNLEYSNRHFKLNFPLLVEAGSRYAQEKRARYYIRDVAPIELFGKKYLITSQWYEHNRDCLIRWMERFDCRK